MNIFATPEQVAILKKRAGTFAAENYNGADSKVLPFLIFFNDQPGIATVWSCQGHYGSDTGNLDEGEFYVMLAVTEEGFQMVEKFYSKLRDRLSTVQDVVNNETPRVYDLRMSFTTRRWVYENNGNTDEVFNVINFAMTNPYSDCLKKFVEEAIEAAKDAVYEKGWEEGLAEGVRASYEDKREKMIAEHFKTQRITPTAEQVQVLRDVFDKEWAAVNTKLPAVLPPMPPRRK